MNNETVAISKQEYEEFLKFSNKKKIEEKEKEILKSKNKIKTLNKKIISEKDTLTLLKKELNELNNI